jgi:hypothetical protein
MSTKFLVLRDIVLEHLESDLLLDASIMQVNYYSWCSHPPTSYLNFKRYSLVRTSIETRLQSQTYWRAASACQQRSGSNPN